MSPIPEHKFDAYYLGLDIGTDSVGWAVTDLSYNILRYRGKDMWGVHLFESANTAAERRKFRTARRRRDRARKRLEWFRELMGEAINAVDPGFFRRLEEARLHRCDRSLDTKNTLFDDPDFCDRDYHRQWPTVYHLRRDLMKPWKKPFDIRLVYLAVAHILKSRGNFLYQGASFETGQAFEAIYEALTEAAKELNFCIPSCNYEELKNALMQKGIKFKKEQLVALLQAKSNKQLTELIGMIAGANTELKDLFRSDDENDKDRFDGVDNIKKFSLAKADFDETILPELEVVLDENELELIVQCKKLYDWTVLCNILGEHDSISDAMIAQYDEHKKQLKCLRRLVKKYIPEQYYAFFKDKKANNNYIAWIGKGEFKNNGSVCSQEEFEKAVKGLLSKIPDDAKGKAWLRECVENHELLPKCRTGNNGVIPYQLHLNELRQILENASKHYAFLNEIDTEGGLSVAQKIEKLLTFRIPYYVGPLNGRHNAEDDPLHGHAWIVRNKGYEHTPVRPWNFERVVNLDACAEAFIRRMTNRCTYLPSCDVVPKESLLYSEYNVFNQMNNLRIDGKPLDRCVKKKLVALCRTRRAVSAKDIETLLNLKERSLTGFEGDLRLSLKSYHDFKAILGEEKMKLDNVRRFVESCIQACTVFNESTGDLLEKRIQKEANQCNVPISQEQLRKIAKLKYKDWGNFSREFLTQINGHSNRTGECYSIIQALEEETDNLMQLLSARKYSFEEEIRRYNDENRKEVSHLSYNALVKPLRCSPSVKRAIWRSLAIVKDILRITKNPPLRIFVEMARDDAKQKAKNKGKRTTSRQKQLQAVYEGIKNDPQVTELLKQLKTKTDDDLRKSKDKLYLYFCQNGRCMYSGEPIDLDRLLSDQNGTVWDIDHIYPQSKVIDNSLDNRVLVKKDLNHKKGNKFPIPSNVVSEKAKDHWKWLVGKGLISQEKYNRLVRNNPLSAEELGGFISRQLVETRQTTKQVCELLRTFFAKKKTEIVYSHAGCVSEFRKTHTHPDRGQCEMVKCRDVNDFHHAKDAYLNIVVGNIFHTRFTGRPGDVLVSEDVNVRYYTKADNEEGNKKGNGLLEDTIERYAPTLDRKITAWIPGKSIGIVRKMMRSNRIQFTRYTFENKGGFYDQMPLKASACAEAKMPKIPLKSETACLHDCGRYGGYDNEKGAYFILVEYTEKKKRIRAFRHVPVRLAAAIRRNPECLLQYCRDPKPLGLGLREPKVLIDKVLFDAKLIFDGFPFTINGRSGTSFLIRHCLQMVLPDDLVRYLKIILKSVEAKQCLPEITPEENMRVYHAFLNKHKNVYNKRPSSQLKTLESNVEVFKKLELLDQCMALKNILTLFTCSTGGVTDLSLIKGAKHAGLMTESMDITKVKKPYLEHQTPTGLTCTRVDLKEENVSKWKNQ